MFGGPAYWIIGFQRTAKAFFIYITSLFLVGNIGSSLGLMVGIVSRDASVAISMVPLIVIPFMIFSGYFINSDSTPPYFIWIEYISFFKYSFRAVVLSEVINIINFCVFH